MPAPPELGDRPGRVGIIEVLEEIDAEELGQPDGHVRVPGEIEVDLQRVAGDPQPGQAEVQLAAGRSKMASAATATVLATSIFLASPMMNRRIPRRTPPS